MANVDAEVARLRAENLELRALLAAHGIGLPQHMIDEPVAKPTVRVGAPTLSPQEKVKIFRRLFQGRDDVYPIRWESQQSGKAGYSPACANEWRRGVCEKPRVKCSQCQHSLYVPVTEHTIVRHLKGEITAGVYPLLADDSCYFLAIDFDDDEWREDAKAVLKTCVLNRLPAALEISRSGNGEPVRIFV